MGELNYYTQLKARNEIWDHTPVSKISIISLINLLRQIFKDKTQ